MAEHIAETAVVIDATGARRGAQEFVQAAEKVKGANQNMQRSQERLQAMIGSQEKAIERLERRYVPLAAATRKYTTDEERLQRVISAGGPGVERATRVLEALRQERAENSAEARKLAAEEAKLEANARRLVEAVNPAARAQRTFNEQMASADELLTKQKISQEDYNKAVAQYRGELDRATRAQVGQAQAQQMSLGLLFKANPYLTRNIMDVANVLVATRGDLASTLPPLLDLREQFAYAFEQADRMTGATKKAGQAANDTGQDMGGAAASADDLASGVADIAEAAEKAKPAVGRFGGLLASIFTPKVLAIGGIATGLLAVVGVAAAVALRLSEVNAQARQMETIARTLNPALQGQAANLRAITMAIAHEGDLSRAAAANLVAGFVRNPELSRNLYQDLGTTAVNIAASKGEDAAGWASKLGKAFSGGAQGVRELDDELRFLTPAQRDNINALERQGQKTEALAVAVAALKERFKDSASSMKSEWGRAIDDIKTFWDDLLETAARKTAGLADLVSGAIRAARTKLHQVFGEDDAATQTDPTTARIAALKQQTLEAEEELKRLKELAAQPVPGDPGRGAMYTQRIAQQTAEVARLRQETATLEAAARQTAQTAIRLPTTGGKPLELSSADIDALTRAVVAEAAGEGRAGQEAVARVILNRLGTGKFGGSVQEVVNQKGQFEPVGRVGGWQNLPEPTAEQRAMVEGFVRNAAQGAADPTNGALFFLNREIARQRGTDFGQGRQESAVIGRHTFYAALDQTGPSRESIIRLKEHQDALDREAQSLKGTARERQANVAWQNAFDESLSKYGDVAEATIMADRARQRVLRDQNIEVQDQNQLLDLNTRKTLDIAAAYRVSTVEGLRAEAARQAAADALQTGVDARLRQQQILQQGAAEAAITGSAQLTRTRTEVTGQAGIVKAAQAGLAAQQAAQRAFEAANAYRDAVEKAQAAHDTPLEATLRNEQQDYEKLLQQRDALATQLQGIEMARQSEEENRALEKQLKLVGATALEQEKENALLDLRKSLIQAGFDETALKQWESTLGRLVDKHVELNDLLRQQKEAQAAARQVFLEAASAMTDAFEELIFQGGSFRDVIKSLSQTLLRLGTDLFVRQPLQNWIQGATGGQQTGSGTTAFFQMLGNFGAKVAGLWGGGGAADAVSGVTTATSGGLGGAPIIPVTSAPLAHTGWLVGQEAPSQRRTVPSHIFVNAPRLHRGGLAGDEYAAILQTGEEVLTRNNPRHRRNMRFGSAPTVVLNISTPDASSFRASQSQVAATAQRAMSLAFRRNG